MINIKNTIKKLNDKNDGKIYHHLMSVDCVLLIHATGTSVIPLNDDNSFNWFLSFPFNKADHKWINSLNSGDKTFVKLLLPILQL